MPLHILSHWTLLRTMANIGQPWVSLTQEEIVSEKMSDINQVIVLVSDRVRTWMEPGSPISDFLLFLPSTRVCPVAELPSVECPGTVFCVGKASNHRKVLWKRIWLEGKRWESNKIANMKELSWKTVYKCDVAFWLSLVQQHIPSLLGMLREVPACSALVEMGKLMRRKGRGEEGTEPGKAAHEPTSIWSKGTCCH